MKKLLLVTIVVLLLAGGALLYKSYKAGNLGKSGIPNTLPSNQTTPNTDTTSEKAGGGNNQITLIVDSPADGAIVTTPQLTVTGKTAANGDVFVNDTETKADESGNFSAVITLDEGENTVTVVVNDQNGNSSEKDLTVTYNSGQ